MKEFTQNKYLLDIYIIYVCLYVYAIYIYTCIYVDIASHLHMYMLNM